MSSTRDSFDLTGRRALVTGASRGIGLAVAAALAQRGAAVAITGRKPENLTAAAAELQNAGADTRTFVCHQGDPEAVSQLFAQLDQAAFAPDIVVINAATNPVYGPLMDLDLDAWQKIFYVNLTGALLTAQSAARRMMSQHRGSIVFMASIAGIDPLAGLGAYSVGKAGLLGLMRAVAEELVPKGIRVKAVAPGLIETRFSAALVQNEMLGYWLIVSWSRANVECIPAASPFFALTPLTDSEMFSCRQPFLEANRLCSAARRFPRQLFRLSLARDSFPDKRVVSRALPLHLVPLVLLADGVWARKLTPKGHFIDNPQFDLRFHILHRPSSNLGSLR